jgi:hypothetical protein
MVVASAEIRGRQMTRFFLPIGDDLNSISSTHFVCVRGGVFTQLGFLAPTFFFIICVLSLELYVCLIVLFI